MPASANDKFLQTGYATATTLSAPGYTIGDASINVGSTTNWPTATGVIFGVDNVTIVNGEEVRTPGSYCVFAGTVNSATSINNLTLLSGTPQNYSAGALTRVYITISSLHNLRLWQGLTAEHSQLDGTHDATKVAMLAGTQTFTGNKTFSGTVALPSNTVTNANLATTSGELGAAWLAYTPALTNVSIGNGTITASYSKRGKTVHFKVKVVLGSTSTVTGLIGVALPLTAATVSVADMLTRNVQFVDSSASARVYCIGLFGSTTRTDLYMDNVAGTYSTITASSGTAPFTWATSDEIHVVGTYEIA